MGYDLNTHLTGSVSGISVTRTNDAYAGSSSEWFTQIITVTLTAYYTNDCCRQAYLDQFETWGSAEIRDKLPQYSFEEVMTDDRKLHDCLVGLCRFGLALLVGAPTEKGVLKQLEERIGFVTVTPFG